MQQTHEVVARQLSDFDEAAKEAAQVLPEVLHAVRRCVFSQDATRCVNKLVARIETGLRRSFAARR